MSRLSLMPQTLCLGDFWKRVVSSLRYLDVTLGGSRAWPAARLPTEILPGAVTFHSGENTPVTTMTCRPPSAQPCEVSTVNVSREVQWGPGQACPIQG